MATDPTVTKVCEVMDAKANEAAAAFVKEMTNPNGRLRLSPFVESVSTVHSIDNLHPFDCISWLVEGADSAVFHMAVIVAVYKESLFVTVAENKTIGSNLWKGKQSVAQCV
jgi:hypothetical protein